MPSKGVLARTSERTSARAPRPGFYDDEDNTDYEEGDDDDDDDDDDGGGGGGGDVGGGNDKEEEEVGSGGNDDAPHDNDGKAHAGDGSGAAAYSGNSDFDLSISSTDSDGDIGAGSDPDLANHPDGDNGGRLCLMLTPQQNGGDAAREQMLALVGWSVLKEFGEGVAETWHIGEVVWATSPEADDDDHRDD